MSPAYLTRVLRLAFLAPDVIAAMLAGRQKVGVNLTTLTLGIELPASWDKQRAMLLP